MNERLLELAHRAKIEFTYDPTEIPMRAFAECWEDELAKFAELIVQECANELLKWRQEPFPLDADSAARIIKQHFDIK